MKHSLLAQNLKRKAERALISARELQDRDPDGSINRSYYAMFDIARAALLAVDIGEDELPRTHSGVIAAFSKHAVQSGRIEQKLSGALGRTESLRLMADYTGAALDAKSAAETVIRAEAFVGTVVKVFALEELSNVQNLENDAHHDGDKISEPRLAMEQSDSNYKRPKRASLEEIRRDARENWLKTRQQKVGTARGTSKEADRGCIKDLGHSIDDDFDD